MTPKKSVEAHFDRFAPQKMKNHQLYVLAILSLRPVGFLDAGASQGSAMSLTHSVSQSLSHEDGCMEL